ncbi:MAG: hypothetical protein ACPGU5_07585 [Lishizhenia sp.]
MDSGVEHITDLGLVNYVQHPTNPDYIVFRFADIARAETFERELRAQGIWFEKGEEKPRTRTFYLFGVYKRDYKKVQQINFNTEATHRSFLIKNDFFRYFLLLFVLLVVSLAVFGYCKQQKIIKEKTSILNQVHSQ